MKTFLEKKLVIDTTVTQCSSSLESAVPTTPLDVKMDESLRRTFFPSKTVNRVQIFNREGKVLPLEISPRLDRGFFVTNDQWTSYRRNYFQVSAGFKIAEEGFIATPDGMKKISCYKVLLRGQIQDTMAKIPLLQHNSKRQKTCVVEPGLKVVLPNGTPGNISDSDAGRVVTFDRIQFRNATGNNGKRRKGQQYYNLVVEIQAFCGEKSFIVGEITSVQLIVRGRSPSHYGPKSALQLRTPNSLNTETSPLLMNGSFLSKSGQNTNKVKFEKDEESSPQTPYSAPLPNSQLTLSGSQGFHGEMLANDWLHSRDPTATENTSSMNTDMAVDMGMKRLSVETENSKNAKVFGTIPSAAENSRYSANSFSEEASDYRSSVKSGSFYNGGETFTSLAAKYANLPALNEALGYGTRPTFLNGAPSMSSSNDSMDYHLPVRNGTNVESPGRVSNENVRFPAPAYNEPNPYALQGILPNEAPQAARAVSQEPGFYGKPTDTMHYSRPIFDFGYGSKPTANEQLNDETARARLLTGCIGRGEQIPYEEIPSQVSNLNEHVTYETTASSHGPMSYPPRYSNGVPYEPVAFEPKRASSEFLGYDASKSQDFDFNSKPVSNEPISYSARSATCENFSYESPVGFDCSPAETRSLDYRNPYEMNYEGHTLDREGLYREKMSSQQKPQDFLNQPAGLSQLTTFQYPEKVKVEPLHFERNFAFMDSSFLTPPVRDPEGMVLTSPFSNYSLTPTSTHPPWGNIGFTGQGRGF